MAIKLKQGTNSIYKTLSTEDGKITTCTNKHGSFDGGNQEDLKLTFPCTTNGGCTVYTWTLWKYTCTATYPCGDGGTCSTDAECKTTHQCKSNKCEIKPCTGADTVLSGAKNSGTCGAVLDVSTSCSQEPTPGYTCSASTCSADSQLTQGTCTANTPCSGADTLLTNAEAAGTCGSSLAAAKSCVQTPKTGYSCTETRCSAEGTTLTPGQCIPQPCQTASTSSGASGPGTCNSVLARGSNCLQAAKTGYTCAVSKCSADGVFTQGECTPNPACSGADTLLEGGASKGTCASSLAAGSSCTQTGKEGYTCTATTCPVTGTTLVPGVCTKPPSTACCAAECGGEDNICPNAASCVKNNNQIVRTCTCRKDVNTCSSEVTMSGGVQKVLTCSTNSACGGGSGGGNTGGGGDDTGSGGDITDACCSRVCGGDSNICSASCVNGEQVQTCVCAKKVATCSNSAGGAKTVTCSVGFCSTASGAEYSHKLCAGALAGATASFVALMQG